MRIACVLDVDYEDSEFKQPYGAHRKAPTRRTIFGRTHEWSRSRRRVTSR